jgi:hypothetical protein
MKNKNLLWASLGILALLGGYYWFISSQFKSNNAQKNNRKIILIGNK